MKTNTVDTYTFLNTVTCSKYGRHLCICLPFPQDQNIAPQHLAVDRPSHKFSSFLAKHYSLTDEIPQVNNFVIFDGFFTKRPGKHKYEDFNRKVYSSGLVVWWFGLMLWMWIISCGCVWWNDCYGWMGVDDVDLDCGCGDGMTAMVGWGWMM